jgi:hypothetical protein
LVEKTGGTLEYMALRGMDTLIVVC